MYPLLPRLCYRKRDFVLPKKDCLPVLITSRLDITPAPVCQERISSALYPPGFLREKVITIREPGISHLVSHQIIADDFFIIDTYMQFTQPVRDFFEVSEESILLSFLFQGQVTGDVHQLEDAASYAGNQHALRYTPRLQAVLYMPPHEPLNYFVLVLSRAFYFRLLAPHYLLHQPFAADILRGRSAQAAKRHLPITAAMHRVIHAIRQCTRTGEIKRLLLEARILELLTLQFEQLQQTSPPSPSVLRGDDRSKVERARALLETSYTEPPGLKELARLVGLNEYKLKSGFKERFATTVRAYVIQLRLTKAHQLLQTTTYSIQEIALRVGYKNGAQFTASFRNQYHYLPSDLRK